MVVGDSINHEIAWSFMNHLVLSGQGYGHMSSGDRSNDGVYEMCGDIFGAGNGFKVAFVRNDRLSPVANISVDTWRNFYEWPWLDLLKEYDVRLLLLNRGAHYEDDKTFVRALRLIFTILSEHFPHMQVIFRNTPPGNVPSLPALLGCILPFLETFSRSQTKVNCENSTSPSVLALRS